MDSAPTGVLVLGQVWSAPIRPLNIKTVIITLTMTSALRGTDTNSHAGRRSSDTVVQPVPDEKKKNKRMRKLVSIISCKDLGTLYS